MTKAALARYLILLGLPLFSVCYTSFNLKLNKLDDNLSRKSESKDVSLPGGKVFEPVRKLAEDQQYIEVIERLKNIPKTNPQYGEVNQIKAQYKQKAVEMLGACPHGYDPEALKQSSFYRASAGQYIAQVECYSSAVQPAYEYYLYNEFPTSTKVKPLNLTQFEQTYHTVSKKDSNFVVGSPDFNQQTKELAVARKYGDKGDCGTVGEYKFDKDEFVLRQFLADFRCGDGKLQYEKIYPQRISMKN